MGMLSDASNYEETAAALSSIRSNLCKPEKITKHESQHSMTTIVDLVKKTKQSIALTLLNDNDDSVSSSDDDAEESLSGDDSFSDHLGLIEDMLCEKQQEKEVEDEKDINDEFGSLDISNIQMLNGTGTENESDSDEDENDEPPLFWTSGGDEDSFLQRMIADPNQILDDVMSPIPSHHFSNKVLSDWDDDDKMNSLSSDSPKIKKKKI